VPWGSAYATAAISCDDTSRWSGLQYPLGYSDACPAKLPAYRRNRRPLGPRWMRSSEHFKAGNSLEHCRIEFENCGLIRTYKQHDRDKILPKRAGQNHRPQRVKRGGSEIVHDLVIDPQIRSDLPTNLPEELELREKSIRPKAAEMSWKSRMGTASLLDGHNRHGSAL
jgi:hypothetical protein